MHQQITTIAHSVIAQNEAIFNILLKMAMNIAKRALLQRSRAAYTWSMKFNRKCAEGMYELELELVLYARPNRVCVLVFGGWTPLRRTRGMNPKHVSRQMFRRSAEQRDSADDAPTTSP